MTTRDYISAIAIERLLEDETLPADIRQQAEQVLADLLQERSEFFDWLLSMPTTETQQ